MVLRVKYECQSLLLKSFSLCVVKFCSRWLEMVVCYRYWEMIVCYRWLEMVVCYRWLKMVCFFWNHIRHIHHVRFMQSNSAAPNSSVNLPAFGYMMPNIDAPAWSWVLQMIVDGCLLQMVGDGCLLQMVGDGCLLQMVGDGCFLKSYLSYSSCSLHAIKLGSR